MRVGGSTSTARPSPGRYGSQELALRRAAGWKGRPMEGHSIYFAGPEHLALEVATSAEPIDERAWIDPEVVELVGIDAALLERLKSPAAFESQGGAVPNPPVDWSKPQLSMPREVLEKVMAMPDDNVTARLSQPDPPVAVERGAGGE